jgi:hypothetical protein
MALGMKVKGERKGPYDELSRRMLAGRKMQNKLERDPGEGARKGERRLPKATPSSSKRGSRA